MHKRTVQRRQAAKWRAQSRSRQYGFPIEQTYNLDYTIACFILPRLKAFRKHTISYPGSMTFEEWQSTLDEMISGFEIYVKNDQMNTSNEDIDKVNKALKLFAEWYWDLWW